MIWKSLIGPLYLCITDIKNGIYCPQNADCACKYSALLFADYTLWNMYKKHKCNQCIIPVHSVKFNENELMKIMNELMNDEQYSRYVSTNISILLS